MNDERRPGVLEGLPHTRPHRRSAKRAAKPRAEAKPTTEGKPTTRAKAQLTAPPAPGEGAAPLATAVQAAAELAEIGLTVGARALRGALSRLPRP